jgi:hypothetical protein
MKPEITRRWIEALRSGEYEQGRGFLKLDGRYCCLGVLCDLAAKDGAFEWAGEPLHADTLPRPVAEWADAGSQQIDGVSFPDFAEANDYRGATFHEIADVLECLMEGES